LFVALASELSLAGFEILSSMIKAEPESTLNSEPFRFITSRLLE
jgi:hypothetical protein